MACEAIIAVDAANVRVEPRTGTSIVGIVRRGERAPVNSRTDAVDASGFFWFNITVPANGQTGWVRADLIQLSGDCSQFGTVTTTPEVTTDPTAPEPSNEPEQATSAGNTTEEPIVLIGDCMAEVNVSMATVRSGPGLGNSILGFINRDKKFAITDISEADSSGFKWYGLEFQSNTGWIREDLADATGDCLDLRTHGNEDTTQPETEEPTTSDPEPDQPTTSDPDPQPTTTEACTALAGLPQASVRALPTTNSQRLGMATKNQRFAVRNITATQSDGFTWTEITFNGQAGFIRSDLITLLGDCSRFTNDDRLPRPVSGRITQGFRPSNNPTHNGVDFGTSGNQEMRTAIPAVVDRAHPCTKCTASQPNTFPSDSAAIQAIFNDSGWGFGYGNHIILRYAFADLPRTTQEEMRRMGLNERHFAFVLFAHLSRMNVSQGQSIEAGFLFGVTGHTGYSSAEHLHMEVALGSAWGNATKVHPATLFSVIRA